MRNTGDRAERIRHYRRRLSGLEEERKRGWEPHWRDLSRHFAPRRARFLDSGEKTNDGDVKNHLADDVGILAVRTLSSGMQSGLTSPARPWFALSLQDEEAAQVGSVRHWLHDTYERMVNIFARSNFYDQIHMLYRELGVFGTGVMLVEEDKDTAIRCRTLTAGEYALDVNASGRVDSLYRRVRMTARQIVEAWTDTVPQRIKDMADKDNGEWLTLLHAIEPNPEHDAERASGRSRPWVSVYMLLDAGNNDVLEESGYYEFPALCPRWDTTASDVYGSSPAMDALADCRMLQKIAEDGIIALEKEVNPPLISYMGDRASIINASPGGITNAGPLTQGKIALEPLYQVRANLQGLEALKAQLKQQIREMFFNDLFLMITQANRQMTATEVAERNAEKMLLLGPVLDRLRSELFQPLIERVFGVMSRKGLVALPPDELSQQQIKIEFISILAQAQKQAGIAAINQTVGFIGQVAQMNPEALDKLNLDEAIDEVAEMHGVPPKLIRSAEEVQALREQRQQQMQQMQMMQMMREGADIAAKGAQAARDAGMTPDAMAAAQGAGGQHAQA